MYLFNYLMNINNVKKRKERILLGKEWLVYHVLGSDYVSGIVVCASVSIL